MTDAQTNVATIRGAFDAFAARDLPALAELLADDVVWRNHGCNPLSGRFAGKTAVFGMMARNLELNEGTGGFDIHDVLANDAHAVALLNARTSRPSLGRSLDIKEIHVFHVREGRIAEAWVFSEDQRLNDEFWS